MHEVERALELEQLAPPTHVADRVCAHLGAHFKYAGDFEGARRWLDETHRAAVEEGDDGSLPFAASHYPQLELWTGNWERAAEAAREHLELAEQTGQPGQRAQALHNVALVAAHQGREAEARAAAAEALEFAEQNADSWAAAAVLADLGFLELSLGVAAEAVRNFDRHFALLDEIGVTEPRRLAPDYIESLLEVGDLERARELLEAFEERARIFGRVPALAGAARARALVAAATGDLDAAVAALDDALTHHERVSIPFEVARTRLVLGTVRRRRREKRLAREALEEALRIFEELGASLWARRAKDELARVGLRRAAGDELTETERRIAELAASGLTNREIAQAAFVSPKTVEANLARVYRKLGIRSRAELGARMVGSTPPQT
jgi:DNA-binding CsgD family transcriptional regulator